MGNAKYGFIEPYKLTENKVCKKKPPRFIIPTYILETTYTMRKQLKHLMEQPNAIKLLLRINRETINLSCYLILP